MMAIFFSMGLGIGGVVSPWLFGSLIKSGRRDRIFLGYLVGIYLIMIYVKHQL